ncbi:hypothetical protein PENSPDRAFT_250493 [Peniophora sp. CONT]|nr:hypothetical protein PENSPDRAFT_250493 [Peniophora sp. CONT]
MAEPSAPELSVARDVLPKLQWAYLGLCSWEYLTHLDHDWRLARSALPWRWPLTTWAYLLSRYSMLLTAILPISGLGTISCNAVMRVFFVFPCVFYLSSTYLIVARTVAIWARALWILIIAGLGILTQLVVWVHALAIFQAADILLPGMPTPICAPIEGQSIQSTVITNAGVDMVVLALMFVGLWRRPETRAQGNVGLVHVLWTQGLVLLAVVFIAGIPLIVVMTLRVNDVAFSIAITTSFTLQGLGSTRMARNLYVDKTLAPVAMEGNASTSSGQLELSTVNVPVSYLDLSCAGNKAESSSSVV